MATFNPMRRNGRQGICPPQSKQSRDSCRVPIGSGFHSLSLCSTWVHTHLELNVLGRTKANPPVLNDEGEEVPDPNAPEASAALRGVADDPVIDEAAEEGGGAWEARAVPVSGAVEGDTPTLAVLRSLRWPGAFTVGFAKKRYANIYVGYGHEVSTTRYMPALPSAAPTEFDFTIDTQVVKEQVDVTKDPDEGKPKEGEDGEEGADE
jgi:hypothetical protein